VNALEVSIDGKRIGIYVPPDGCPFAAMVGNIPRVYMRAHIMTSNDAESWQWQLPDIKPGQRISFRQIEAPTGSGVPPQFVRSRDPREVEKCKREGRRLYTKVGQEMAAKKRKDKSRI
jgi:hypothetical protein